MRKVATRSTTSPRRLGPDGINLKKRWTKLALRKRNCYNCEELDHFITNCPIRKEDNAYKLDKKDKKVTSHGNLRPRLAAR